MSEARKPTFLQHLPPVARASVPTPRPAPWAATHVEGAHTPRPSAALSPAPLPPIQSPPTRLAPEPTLAPPPPPFPTPAPIVIDHTPRLQAGLDALRLEAQRLAEQARSDALEIGVLIARRVLERELTASLDPLFGLIRGAVRKVGEARQIIVRVSVEDHRRLQESPGSSLSLGTVTLVADESLSPGDVIVESDRHDVDARLDTRLEELRRELRASMQQE
ncbi:MAG: flagellar assembly protein FliH [Myxococcaceae bacterium]|nr:flagellar assembly protein FliH [Myxococcaceae bacterium]MCA3015492.1 flagellar assembly protein FliH [Myxococcaceae bacterium]